MRRSFSALALVLLCTTAVTGCDKAKEALNSVGCSGLQAAAKALPKADSLSDSTINGLASAAGAVSKALKALPTDKVPAGAQEKVDKAVTDINDAVSKFASDPSAAKASAAKAIDSLQSAVTDTEGKLGC